MILRKVEVLPYVGSDKAQGKHIFLQFFFVADNKSDDNADKYLFKLYRITPGSDPVLIRDIHLDEVFYHIDTVELALPLTDIEYNYQIIHEETGRIVFTASQHPVIPSEKSDFLEYRAFLYNYIDQLKTTGYEALIFKRRRWGVTCDCTVSSHKESAVSACPVCYSTTFVGGYHDPIKIPLDMGGFNNITMRTDMGFKETNQMQGTILPFPIVEPGDLIYVIKGGILLGVDVAAGRHGLIGSTIMQKVTATTVEKYNGIEYQMLKDKGIV